MDLALLRKPHATAYEGIVRWLMADTRLSDVVTVWHWNEGDDVDQLKPVVDDFCTVRITPELGPAEVMASDGTTRVWSRPLDITIDTDVAAPGITDDFDLAHAIFGRLFPTRSLAENDQLQALLAQWGVMEIVEVMPAAGSAEGLGTPGNAGKYRLEMWMHG